MSMVLRPSRDICKVEQCLSYPSSPELLHIMSRRRKFETIEPFEELGLKTRQTKRGKETTTKTVRLRLPRANEGPPSSAEPSPGPSVASTPAPVHIQLPSVESGEPLPFEFTFENTIRSGKVRSS